MPPVTLLLSPFRLSAFISIFTADTAFDYFRFSFSSFSLRAFTPRFIFIADIIFVLITLAFAADMPPLIISH